MKLNFAEMKNVKNGEFELNGEKWMMADYRRNRGTSPRGLWNDMTNGKKLVRVYKCDVAKASLENSKRLFN